MTATVPDVLPPHDAEAELSALSCIVSEPDKAGARLAGLSEEMFYEIRGRVLYKAMVTLQAAGETVDCVHLYQALKQAGQLDEAGGFDFVQRLPDFVPSAASFPVWLDALNDFARRRADLAEAARLRLAALDGLPQPTSAPDGSDESIIAEYQALPLLERERSRDETAKRLGVRPLALDKYVAGRRPKGNPEGEDLQGRSLNLADPEPWPEVVVGADVLAAVAENFSRYIALPDGAADALALWVLHTHCFECFICTPRLNIASPEKQCGNPSWP